MFNRNAQSSWPSALMFIEWVSHIISHSVQLCNRCVMSELHRDLPLVGHNVKLHRSYESVLLTKSIKMV